MAGDDYNAFLAQAAQYRLPERVQLLSEVVDLTVPRAVGDAALGLISSMRYDNPRTKSSSHSGKKNMTLSPTTMRASSGKPVKMLAAGIEKAGSTETASLRSALEKTAIDDIKGHVAMRKCDHQAVQNGYMVKLAKGEGFYPCAADHRDLPRQKTTPACNKMTFED